MHYRIALILAATLLATACAGKVDYAPPQAAQPGQNSITVSESADAVWKKLVPKLGQQFFVVNNLDKDSGFINVSYSGDPERYVDCGTITSYVKNARGPRTYVFPGAKAQQSYEVMSDGLYFLDRKMNLEGRVNIIVERQGPKSTRITANTRYVLTRSVTVQSVGGQIPQTATDSVSFDSGQSGTFSSGSDRELTCTAKGTLEQSVLDLAH
ncbi:hypothetical protein [Inquilinus sp.]|uniref:hypothetical protein n=1 Tax=Inquilinus sp. TaxID=1932117 RepID=UPI0031D9767C